MRAGRLNRRITWQSPTPTRNAFGEEIITWSNAATQWAAILPLRGEEYTRGRALEAAITHRIVTRYRTDITPTTDWRIQHTDRGAATQTYDIESIVETATRGRQWEIMVREQV